MIGTQIGQRKADRFSRCGDSMKLGRTATCQELVKNERIERLSLVPKDYQDHELDVLDSRLVYVQREDALNDELALRGRQNPATFQEEQKAARGYVDCALFEGREVPQPSGGEIRNGRALFQPR